MPSDRDEGIYSVALLMFLHDTHNNFLQKCKEILKEPSEYKVPVQAIHTLHVIRYDLDEEIEPIIRSHSNFNFSFLSNVLYDFEAIQQFIIVNDICMFNK